MKLARDNYHQQTNSINNKKRPADFKFDVLRNVFIPIESSTEPSKDISTNTPQSNKIDPPTSTDDNFFGFVMNTHSNNLQDHEYDPEDEKQYKH